MTVCNMTVHSSPLWLKFENVLIKYKFSNNLNGKAIFIRQSILVAIIDDEIEINEMGSSRKVVHFLQPAPI